MSEMGETSLAPDPFDPAALRLDQSFAETVGVRKLLTTVPVRKPNRQDFVRVHPDPAYHLTPAAIVELREDHEIYLVTPTMASELPGEFAAATLFTTVNRQGVLHVWPVAASIVLESRQASTARENQSMIATRYRKPRPIGI
jgi:hypothetical protein